MVRWYLDVILEFFGGPLDGGTMTSDAADPLERNKVQWIARIVGSCLVDAEKKEVKFDPNMIYTVPSEEIMERAKAEGWSEAKIAALMPRYEYVYRKHREENGIAHISLQFKACI